MCFFYIWLDVWLQKTHTHIIYIYITDIWYITMTTRAHIYLQNITIYCIYIQACAAHKDLNLPNEGLPILGSPSLQNVGVCLRWTAALRASWLEQMPLETMIWHGFSPQFGPFRVCFISRGWDYPTYSSPQFDKVLLSLARKLTTPIPIWRVQVWCDNLLASQMRRDPEQGSKWCPKVPALSWKDQKDISAALPIPDQGSMANSWSKPR